MPYFRYHFSSRDYYKITFEAKDLDDARKQLEYCGVNYQNDDYSGFLEEKDIPHEEEDYILNDNQWEEVSKEEAASER